MPLISSNNLDDAFIKAHAQDPDAVLSAALALGGDGCNEIDNLKDILAALDTAPHGTPVCIAGYPNGDQWYYFLGTESEVLSLLDGIS